MKLFKASLAAILSVCILSSSLTVMAVDNTNAKQSDKVAASVIQYGDADADGDVDMQDVAHIESYLNGKSKLASEENADVNADGKVDEIDVNKIKDYLVGNIKSLKPEFVTVSFDTKGGNAIESMKTGKGYGIARTLPTPSKENCIFIGWTKSDGSEFFKDDPINEDITLVAKYEDVSQKEQILIDSYSLTNCSKDITFIIKGDFDNATVVKSNLKLVPKDGSDPVAIKVVKNSDGTFTVGADITDSSGLVVANTDDSDFGTFTSGGSYELELGKDLYFVDKGEEIRKVCFIIEKPEGDRLYFNNDVIFIQDTEEMTYTIEKNGKTEIVKVLESALLSNDASNDDITGNFTMSHREVEKGDIICIFKTVSPDERDYTKNDYSDDPLAYIEITNKDGNTYTFKSLNDTDASEVILMPDSIPFSVSKEELLPAGNTGSVNKNAYDTVAREMLGYKKEPEYNVNDFLVFYVGSFEEADNNTPVVYAQITGVSEFTVDYKIVSKDYIDSFMGLFVSNDVTKEELLENVDESKLLESVAAQVEESGFAEESAQYMLQSAIEDEALKDKLLENGLDEEEIEYYATATNVFAAPTGGKTKATIERTHIKPSIIKGEHFENGVGIRLDLSVVVSIDTMRKIKNTVPAGTLPNGGATSGGETSTTEKLTSLKVNLFASFEQEIALGIDVNIEDEWKWYAFIPVLEELTCNTSIDLQNYTSVSVNATVYAVQEINKAKWKALADLYKSDPWVYPLIKKYDMAAAKAKRYAKGTNAFLQAMEEATSYLNEIPMINVEGKDYRYDELSEDLDSVTVANSIGETADAETPEDAKVGMQQLMDRYTELLETETDWVQLFEKTLVEKEFHIKVVAINLKIDFVIRGNINLSVGADMEYKVGKRYNFWIKCISCQAGSSEMDLIDERFGFQLYVMGTIGLRAGIKAEVSIGILTTKLGSIGASIEFGPYVKIWGYFAYVYTKLRPANTSTWQEDEQLSGALYLEIGVYITIRFKAQIFDDMFKFEPVLYDDEFPLIKIGENRNVYGFAVNPDPNEQVRITDNDGISSNGISMKLSDTYRLMKNIELTTGRQRQEVYDTDRFNFSSSNRYIKVDRNGVVTVTPPSGKQYLEGEITITWKGCKIAFTVFDMAITIPVVWTSFTDEELNEKFTASVAVGNPTDGYEIVWSDRFTRLQSFNLPEEEKILDLIGYRNFNSVDVNLKYSEVAGYKDKNKVKDLTIDTDTTFYFDVTRREYSVVVNGIHNTDGSTSSRTYKASYGESFNLADLKYTGANNDKEKIHSSFLNVTKADTTDDVFALDTTVGLDFYNKYGSTSAQLTANYNDDSITATYTFKGVDLEPVTVKFKKGEISNFDYVTYVTENFDRGENGKDIQVMNVYPPLEKVEHSIEYVVNCKIIEPAPKYTITFDPMNGDDTFIRQYHENALVQLVGAPGTKTGYNFVEWCTDKACTQKFSFNTSMPAKDFTLYAKWNPLKFNVTFKSDGKIIKTTEVSYNSPYGTLPNYDTGLVRNGETSFKYWYIEKDKPITEDTIFTELKDITLTAHWENKKDINPLDLIVDFQQYKYNEGYELKFSVKGDNYDNLDMSKFAIKYKPNGSTGDGTQTKPTAEGMYDICISRATDEYYKELKDQWFDGKLVIGKVTLNLNGVEVYNKGRTAVIRRPNGYKGSGNITYKIEQKIGSITINTKTNSSGVFNDLAAGTYNYTITVDEDTIFKASSVTGTFKVAGIASGSHDVKFTIHTGTESGSGTDAGVQGAVIYADGGTSSWANFDKSNYDDFENNDTDTYHVVSGVYPWQIIGCQLQRHDSSAISAPWLCDYVNIELHGPSRHDSKKSINTWFGDTNVRSYYTYDFKRDIRLVDRMEGSEDVNLATTSNYSFDNSGHVSDRFYTDYHPMEKYSPPTFSVTSGNTVLDRYIQYTSVTSFELDIDGLKEYVRKTGQGNFTYTATYNFPSSTVSTQTTYTKYINIKTNDVKSNSVGANEVTINSGSPIVQATQSNVSVSASTLGGDPGDTVQVPVYVESDIPVWGMLTNVEFDDSALELLSYRVGNLYTEEEILAQKDLSGGSFKFITTNDEFENTAPFGKLIVIKFRIKDTAPAKRYNIAVNAVQSVDIDSNFKDINIPNKTITVNGFMYGDTNKDGRISVLDATLIQKICVGQRDFEDNIQERISDIDNDGRVSVIDATTIQKYLVNALDEDDICLAGTMLNG